MWGAILGRYMPKPTNIAELKTALLQYGMICHRSSLIRQSCHFERDFDFVLLQLADTLNTQFKYREGSWHSLLKRPKCSRKSCACLLRYYVRLAEYSGRDCMFTWKNELLGLNSCICWTVFVILIKFAGYVDWILVCNLCKFGKYICYNFRDIKFFLGGYIFGAPCTPEKWLRIR